MTTPSVPTSRSRVTAPRSGAIAAATAVPAGASGRTAGGAGWRDYLPGGAGVAYLVAWAAGLAAWPSNLPLNASATQTAASYAAHQGQAVVQYLLVEGLAGVLLGIVLGCAVRSAAWRGQVGAPVRGAAVLGAVAVITSVAQCVTGLALVAAAAGHDVTRCGDLSDLVNRLDGVKMLALAGAGACLALAGRPAPLLPRWLRVVTVPFGIALIASGYAYLALSQSLSWNAYVSGPLLLLWVAGLGITLARRGRMRGRGRRSATATRWPARSR
jgi:hypothetical protein